MIALSLKISTQKPGHFCTVWRPCGVPQFLHLGTVTREHEIRNDEKGTRGEEGKESCAPAICAPQGSIGVEWSRHRKCEVARLQ
jgi:hypothetical protein